MKILKIKLNKDIISSLSNNEMMSVKGGGSLFTDECITTLPPRPSDYCNGTLNPTTTNPTTPTGMCGSILEPPPGPITKPENPNSAVCASGPCVDTNVACIGSNTLICDIMSMIFC